MWVEAPVCKCHGLPEVRNGHRANGKQKWVCRVWRNDRSRRDYQDLTPEKTERRRAGQRERWPNRAADPLYQVQRSLTNMARVRVSY